MFISYDPEIDALLITLGAPYHISDGSMIPGVGLDLTEDGKLTGIEILDVSRYLGITPEQFAELTVQGFKVSVEPLEPVEVVPIGDVDQLANASD
jgi:uncharacterized protein YuzE